MGLRRRAYYRALPFRDLTGRFDGIWRMRARSVRHAGRAKSSSRSNATPRASSIRSISARAAAGWQYRARRRGHAVTAVDLLDDALDGLGATRHFGQSFSAVIAEYDRLPLPDARADLVIFNAALHYSTGYGRTLRESLRVLRGDGTLVILDSPMYVDPSSGQRMVQEREQRFMTRTGSRPTRCPASTFLPPAACATSPQTSAPPADPPTGASRPAHETVPHPEWRARPTRSRPRFP